MSAGEPTAASISGPAAYFVTGGTVPVTSASYITRRADRDLLEGLLGGELCYVLNARQMGKSSLSVRTMADLSARGVRTVFLDLTRIGSQNVTPEQWYMGLLQATGRTLGLRAEMLAYWKANVDLSFAERFFSALRDVALEKLDAPVVIFIDEIDVSRSLSFSADEFFAAIRAFYNARVLDPAYGRIAFCLVGSALPSELIRDTRISPFNIGRRIDLRDFTWEEVQPMAQGLLGVAHAEATLQRVFYWTNGNPYLTQSLCAEVAAHPTDYHRARDVDKLVAALFFDVRARSRNVNLSDVSNRLLRLTDDGSAADRATILTFYRKLLNPRLRVADDEAEPLVGLLKLAGITRSEDGRLRVRCRIYERVFGAHWVEENMPDAEVRRQRAAFRRGVVRTALLGSVVVSVITALAVLAFLNARHARASAEANRRTLYDAEIDQANRALASGELRRAREILNELKPGPGETDLREFTWRMLDRRARDQSQGIFADEGTPLFLQSLTRDERYLAVTAPDKQIRIWEVKSKKLIAQFSVAPNSASALSFTPDNKYLLTVNRNEDGADVWDWRQSPPRKISPPVNSLIMEIGSSAAIFSPNGQTAAWPQDLSQDGKRFGAGLASDRGPVELLRGRDFTLLKRIDGACPAAAVAFTPDSRTLIVARLNGIIQTYSTSPPYIEVGAGAAIRVPGAVYSSGIKLYIMRLAPDGHTMATVGSAASEILLWDLPTHRLLGRLSGHTGIVNAIAFTPDSRTLVSATFDGAVCVWDIAKRRSDAVLYGHQAAIVDVTVASNGRTALTASVDGTIRQWDLNLARRERNGPPKATAGGIAPPEMNEVVEKNIIVRSDDQTLTTERTPSDPNAALVEDVASGQRIVLRDPGMALAPHDLPTPKFTPDGRWLLALSQPLSLRTNGAKQTGLGWILKRWDWRRGIVDRSVALPPIVPDMNALLIDPRGAIAIFVDTANRLHWLDALTGREVVPPIPLRRRPTPFLAVSGIDGAQDPPDSHSDLLFTLPSSPAMSSDAEDWMLLPDRLHIGRYIENLQTNEAVYDLIDTMTGETSNVFHIPVDGDVCGAVTSDGRILVLQPGSRKRLPRYDLSLKSRQPLMPFAPHLSYPAALRSITITDINGSVRSLVLTMSVDGDVHVNDPYTGALLAALRGHQQAVNDADLSPDGRTAATVSMDRTLALWDVQTQRRMASIPLSFLPNKVRFSRRAPLLIVTDQSQNQMIFRGGDTDVDSTPAK